MTNINVQDMVGRTVVDPDGEKVGKVGQVYLDDQTGQPLWITVSTGLFGNKESFAPLYGSGMSGDDVALAVPKALVKDAPNIDADGHLGDEENQALYTHYSGHLAGGSGQSVDRGQAQTDHTSDGSMVRSEEQLRVGTEQVESGRARLRKYVVTENVTTTVPVSHEEVRLEREPITDTGQVQNARIEEDEHEVTLHAERPVVAKETVAVETVRLGTETVTEQQTVNEEVRKEQIDAPETVGTRER